ncbi:Hint domain-containing protein [Marivita sp. XM-24bin2]|mgnify:CR=1 FL=1|jgi:Ca2+-binding RTX toxin-like protein|uniref:Hint domain-containing protein n=1 Tax=unclassified Marivita TaxID=2632480 RepID=UPI000D798B0F|nr:Hint domain-containing protein [Marivita sp. XM-24bin2]MCR9108951.1 Hint domain-containing protein [Paracoccaceae bacterium]PWL36742.1 MAG: hypothetical protein DCO97_02960 [Marivita sp. XM-24bin2]
MATYFVTSSNWNSSAFWSGINQSSSGHTLDFTGLASNFTIDFNADTGLVSISDGISTFLIGDATYGGSADAFLGGTTSWDFFTYLRLNSGENTVVTGSAADLITGDAGDDLINSGDGNDSIYGGTGDLLSPDSGSGNDTIFAGGGSDLVRGEDGNDSLSGEAGNDSLSGNKGDDFVSGGAGADIVTGGQGSDTLLGGTENDMIVGDGQLYSPSSYPSGPGDVSVTLSVTNSADGPITLWWIDQNGVLQPYGTIQPGETVTQQTWTGHNWLLRDENNYFLELIEINGNESIVYGAEGLNDSIDGGSGTDTLMGQFGDDTISGGLDNDQLTGGSGNDTFVYVAGDGVDTITDFNAGNSGTLTDGDVTNNDSIDLSAFYDSLLELQADFDDDGILNQSNDGILGVDYSNNTSFGSGGLVFTGITDSVASFTVENTGVVCFASGTRILTETGTRLIETLRAGERIVTRDNGVQTLRWIGWQHLDTASLERLPKHRPILLAPHLTGGDAPLIVSPQHCVLFKVDGEEKLVRARHLARMQGGAARVMQGCQKVTYYHLMFDAHQIVFANGAPTESFFPGRYALLSLSETARSEVFALFPSLRHSDAEASYGRQAREVMRLAQLPGHLKALSPPDQKRSLRGTSPPRNRNRHPTSYRLAS